MLAKAAEDAPALVCFGALMQCVIWDADLVFKTSTKMLVLPYLIFFLLSSPFPDEYKSKVVCEEERMRLSCKRGMQIAVYSAMFGRTQQGTLECPVHHRRAPSVGKAPC